MFFTESFRQVVGFGFGVAGFRVQRFRIYVLGCGVFRVQFVLRLPRLAWAFRSGVQDPGLRGLGLRM